MAPGPINRLNPLATATTVAALCAIAAFIGGGRRKTPPPLQGIIYSERTETASQPVRGLEEPAIVYPEIRLALEPSARASLPKGSTFVVHLVAPSSGTVLLALADRSRHMKRTAQPAALPIATPPAPVPAQLPAPQSPEPTLEAPPAAPAPPKPTLPATFTEFDEALRGSPTTEGLNFRLRRGGVVFRITHVGRIGDRGAARFAIANEEAGDFFISIVNVTAAKAPIHSETAGPLVCRGGGQEIYGIIHFALPDVKAKNVAIELVQSGGDRRRFQLYVPYRF